MHLNETWAVYQSVALTQTLHTWLRAPLKTCGLLAEFAANIKIHLLFEKKNLCMARRLSSSHANIKLLHCVKTG